jgi:hypothetical protein
VAEINEEINNYIISQNKMIGAVEIIKNPSFLIKRHNLEASEIINIYDIVFNRYKDSLSHYFRTLYHIIKLIDKNKSIDKQFYISIIRSNLTAQESTILMYNCLHKLGVEKFKPLAEKYTLLKYIDNLFLPNLSVKEQFFQSAFDK